jgi:hypothetical protein
MEFRAKKQSLVAVGGQNHYSFFWFHIWFIAKFE